MCVLGERRGGNFKGRGGGRGILLFLLLYVICTMAECRYRKEQILKKACRKEDTPLGEKGNLRRMSR